MNFRIFTLSISLIIYTVSNILFCTNSDLNDVKPLLYKETIYDNKEEFKEAYDANVILTTGEEKQKSILLTNMFNAQNFLNHLDLTIKIIDREEMANIANELNISNFSGLYSPNKKEILIVEYDKDTSIHETGHAVYYQLLNKYEKILINKYFKSEANNLIDTYGKTSAEEFFAVAFTEYIYSPDTLKANCPKIFKLINKVENRLKDGIK